MSAYLTKGTLYTFHMSAAVIHLEDDCQVTGELLDVQHEGALTMLIVKGEETGETIALNTRHVCLIETLGDSDVTVGTPEIKNHADGTRTLTVPLETDR